jgi:hypothetical protein
MHCCTESFLLHMFKVNLKWQDLMHSIIIYDTVKSTKRVFAWVYLKSFVYSLSEMYFMTVNRNMRGGRGNEIVYLEKGGSTSVFSSRRRGIGILAQ